MVIPFITLIASSVRPHLWESCFKSLESNTIPFNVVFAGNVKPEIYKPFENEYRFFKYIETGNIKPAQCYQVAFRKAHGYYIMWIADDCEFSEKALDKIYDRMRTIGRMGILSVKTNEDGKHNDLDDHRFFSENKNTPLMAPLGVMARVDLSELGGFDRRYVCGQYENDVVMRALAVGGKVVKFEDACIDIEHLKKHGSTTKFWTAYDHDRKILEETWCPSGYKPIERPMRVFQPSQDIPMRLYFPITNREVSRLTLLPFEPYSDENLLTVSQSHKGQWE